MVISIKLNNSNDFHFLERTLIQELLFDSESVKDITSSLPDIFPQKFNRTWIELQGHVISFKTVLRGIFYVTSVFPSRKFFPSPGDRFMNFLFSTTAENKNSSLFQIFVSLQLRPNKLQIHAKKFHFIDTKRKLFLIE